MNDKPVAERIKVRDGAAVWRQVEDETVLLALDSSTYIGLNRTGTQLWPLMIEGTTRRELVDLLMSHFDVDAAQATADVEAFVDACDEHGLLIAQR
jgi:hypothetical protein